MDIRMNRFNDHLSFLKYMAKDTEEMLVMQKIYAEEVEKAAKEAETFVDDLRNRTRETRGYNIDIEELGYNIDTEELGYNKDTEELESNMKRFIEIAEEHAAVLKKAAENEAKDVDRIAARAQMLRKTIDDTSNPRIQCGDDLNMKTEQDTTCDMKCNA